jgi:hypothetical protein
MSRTFLAKVETKLRCRVCGQVVPGALIAEYVSERDEVAIRSEPNHCGRMMAPVDNSVIEPLVYTARAQMLKLKPEGSREN